jgi:dipeptidyl aminopeptidase/acylaminoacyl peptidase
MGPGWDNLASWPLRFTRDQKDLLVGLDPQLVEFDNVIPERLALVPVTGDGDPRVLTLPEGWRLQSVPNFDPFTLRQPAGDVLIAVGGHTTSLNQGILRWEREQTTAHIAWQGPGRIGKNASGGKTEQFVVPYQATGDSPDLYAFEEDFSRMRRLTNVEPRLDAVAKTKVEIIKTTVPLYDGSLSEVQTAILLPEDAKAGDRLPGVVVIYPGFDISKTASLFGGGAFATVPNLAFTSRNYAVLLTHIPLSPEGGAGEPVAEMVDALLPQVYHAAHLGYVDGSRLAVMGQSYGGYGVAAVTSRSNLFRAGIAISGLYDLPGHYGEEGRPGWYESAQGRMGTHPWGDRTRYLENSPYYHADNIRTPLLLVHGDADRAIDEARKLFTALQRLERHAELAVYPGQGHGITIWKPESSRDALKRMLAFLERHLK